jgi:hypothetical protein
MSLRYFFKEVICPGSHVLTFFYNFKNFEILIAIFRGLSKWILKTLNISKRKALFYWSHLILTYNNSRHGKGIKVKMSMFNKFS